MLPGALDGPEIARFNAEDLFAKANTGIGCPVQGARRWVFYVLRFVQNEYANRILCGSLGATTDDFRGAASI